MSYNRYKEEIFVSIPLGPNATDFEKRKKWGSDCMLRVAPMITWKLHDVRLSDRGYAYEMLDDRAADGIKRERWLEKLVEITERGVIATKESIQEKPQKSVFIIDNHHHAFYCRYKAYYDGILARWATLIHIDQHSDLSPLSKGGRGDLILKESSLDDIASYTNTILDIGSFILPALDAGIISEQIQVRSEYSLIHLEETKLPNHQNANLLDIDLDFRAPEMSIEQYEQTIKKVRELIALSNTKCITIATSPAFIDQTRALEVLRDIVE